MLSYERVKGTHTTVQDILEIVWEILGVLCSKGNCVCSSQWSSTFCTTSVTILEPV